MAVKDGETQNCIWCCCCCCFDVLMLHVSRCSGCCSCVAVAVVVVQPLFLDALPLALPGSADIYTYIYIHDIACLRPPILMERCSTECGCIARGCSPLEVMSAWGAVSCGSFEFYHSLAQQTWKVSLDPWLKLTVEDLANLSLSPSLANTRQNNCRLSAVFLEFCSRPRTSWRMVTSPSPVRG